MRKKLLFGLLFAAMTAGAVKMKPGINIIKQADGTTITVRAYGDEDLSYFLASDGTLLYQEGTNFYIAGVKADGTLYSTGVLAHEPSMRTIKEISAIKAQNAKAFYNSMETQAKANKVRREPMTPDNSLLPSLGKHKIPVILVEFSDVEFSVENPKATFDKYLNGKELFNKETDPEMGQNYASVAKYFKDMSFGKFEPEFEVYGPTERDIHLRRIWDCCSPTPAQLLTTRWTSPNMTLTTTVISTSSTSSTPDSHRVSPETLQTAYTRNRVISHWQNRLTEWT